MISKLTSISHYNCFPDFKNPEVIATFNPKENSMIHSFSITENYAVLFYYPVYVDGITCLTTQQFHVLNCVKVGYKNPTKNFILNFQFSILSGK